MEVTAGLELTKTGSAGQRLDHFGIITSRPIKVFVGCPKISGLYLKAVQKIACKCLEAWVGFEPANDAGLDFCLC